MVNTDAADEGEEETIHLAAALLKHSEQHKLVVQATYKLISLLLRFDVNPCATGMTFGQSASRAQDEQKVPGVVKLQLEFDEFGEVSEDSGGKGIVEPV